MSSSASGEAAGVRTTMASQNALAAAAVAAPIDSLPPTGSATADGPPPLAAVEDSAADVHAVLLRVYFVCPNEALTRQIALASLHMQAQLRPRHHKRQDNSLPSPTAPLNLRGRVGAAAQVGGGG